ncbi:MAG: hypothetical protein GF418_08450 [Chitinivibrionales bacterium]|nr:hypothetical protein [Chitinivibrionales bacterium]MBD3395643.1 hypothetical protein [Chitinivibrionales bacterium]
MQEEIMKRYVLVTVLAAVCVCPVSFADVEIAVGDDIQAKVDANPAGTTYLIKTGIHRLQSVKPKTGDTFIGEDDAILNGARDLKNWAQEGNRWVHTHTSTISNVHGDCLPTDSMCGYAEDLYRDGKFVQQATNIGDVGKPPTNQWLTTPSMWYFDMANGKVYIGEDPSGHEWEISEKPRAIAGSADNVTIRNLTVLRYASEAQSGAVESSEGGGKANNWLIENCEVAWCHGAGIRLEGNNHTIRQCYIHHMGQLGVTIVTSTGSVFERNELYYNGVQDFNLGWERGATKFVKTDGLVLRNNYSHHNIGDGLWTDIENDNVVFAGNVLVDNYRMGLIHEIGFAADIYCNEIRRNGKSGYGRNSWMYDANLLVSASQDVTVHHNVVEVHKDYGQAITIVQQDRGDDHYTKRIHVHHNDIIWQPDGENDEGNFGADADFDPEPFWAAGNLLFDHDHLHAAELDRAYFRFSPVGRTEKYSSNVSWEDFQALGQETHGTFDDDLSGTEVPADWWSSEWQDSCSYHMANVPESGKVGPGTQTGIRSFYNRTGALTPRLRTVFDSGRRVLIVLRSGRATGTIGVRMLDVSGRLVRSAESADGRLEISLDDLANGLYVARARAGDERLVSLIVMTR